MGRVLSCCATEKTEPEKVVAQGGSPKPRRASVGNKEPKSEKQEKQDKADKPDKADKDRERDKSATTARSTASSKKSGRSSVSGKANVSTATTTSRSSKEESSKLDQGERKTAEADKTSGKTQDEGEKKTRRSSMTEAKPEREASKGPPEYKSEASDSPKKSRRASIAKEPSEAESLAPARTEQEPKRRRASQQSEAGGPGVPEISAPIAMEDATPSTTDFVLFRPLPYDPVPPDAGDNNKQRSFVHKGNLILVPMLPLQSPREGASKSKYGKSEDVRQNKGWKVLKSKVVGAAMKAE